MFMYYSFASWFWHVILDAFDWSLASSNNIFYILASLFVVHPFMVIRKNWLANLCVSFWTFGASIISVSLMIPHLLLIALWISLCPLAKLGTQKQILTFLICFFFFFERKWVSFININLILQQLNVFFLNVRLTSVILEFPFIWVASKSFTLILNSGRLLRASFGLWINLVRQFWGSRLHLLESF